VETPPQAAAAPVAPKAADPAPKPAQTPVTDPAAKAATPPADDPAQVKAAADKAAADALAAKPGEVTDAAAKALADAAAKKTADEAAAKAAESPTGIPADVKYEVKMPQGVELDPDFLPALTPALKKAGITNEQLQALAEGYTQFAESVAPRMLARDLEVTSKDKDLGGMRYAQTLKEVNIALEAFGDPDFKKFVQKAGIANRLEFVRVFQRIGEAMARAGDTPVRGEPDAAQETTRAQRLYGGKSKPST
jgi:hypothetical protein